MRSIYALIIAVVCIHYSYAQQILVGTNAQVAVSAGTVLSAGGLKLMPNTSLTLNDLSIQSNTTVVHAFGNPYVSRVYLFSPNAFVFSGSIQFHYLDSELNGLNESSLQVIAYNGTAWQLAGTSTPDPDNNYVLASGISNLAPGEMILATGLALPLQWGAVSASRQADAAVKIRWSTAQEQNVSHFDIERSIDALHWTEAITGIPAGNQLYTLHYEQTDRPDYTGQLYYRIRQTDRDGRYTVSRIVAVTAENSAALVVIRPNPVDQYFTVTGIAPAVIDKVDLLNVIGRRVQTWNGNHPRYHLLSAPSGIYYVQVYTKNGTVISKQIIVQ